MKKRGKSGQLFLKTKTGELIPIARLENWRFNYSPTSFRDRVKMFFRWISVSIRREKEIKND